MHAADIILQLIFHLVIIIKNSLEQKADASVPSKLIEVLESPKSLLGQIETLLPLLLRHFPVFTNLINELAHVGKSNSLINCLVVQFGELTIFNSSYYLVLLS